MKWGDVNTTQHGKRATVSATSTPENPERGSGPFTGYVVCPEDDAVPVLRIGEEVHSFAWWWDVEVS